MTCEEQLTSGSKDRNRRKKNGRNQTKSPRGMNENGGRRDKVQRQARNEEDERWLNEKRRKTEREKMRWAAAKQGGKEERRIRRLGLFCFLKKKKRGEVKSLWLCRSKESFFWERSGRVPWKMERFLTKRKFESSLKGQIQGT